MLFDEAVLNLNLGCKIVPGHLVVGRFGQNQVKSLVAISQTLDKLVVHDPSFIVQGIGQSGLLVGSDDDEYIDGGSISKRQIGSTTADGITKPVYYIAIKDVIRTISIVTFKSQTDLLVAPTTKPGSNLIVVAGNNQQPIASNIDDDDDGSQRMMMDAKTQHRQSKDLLLIGCSNSVLVYDASSQSNLFSINTPTPISALTMAGEPMVEGAEAATCFGSPVQGSGGSSSSSGTNRPIICGGSQKIYALRFDGCPTFMMDGLNHIFSSNNKNNNNFNVEISSERSTGDTINCLAQGKLNGLDLVLTGSLEHKISIYLLDSFEQNIQPRKLSIEELATINCLCPMNTGSGNVISGDIKKPSPVAAKLDREPREQILPSVIQPSQNQSTTKTKDLLKSTNATNEQMNYFAYGLENGIIGVYRLLLNSDNDNNNDNDTLARNTSLSHERLWRFKCKHTPLTMLMYDIDGDGLDELVVGFRGSRLEVRSPFTGQLMAATRCFKADRLAGLTVMDYHNDGSLMLLACSTSGSLVGYKPKFSKPRRILQGYNLPAATRRAQLDSSSPTDFSFYSLDEIFTYANGTTNLVSDSLDFWSAGEHTITGGGANLKTIEEEQQQQQDIFMTTKGSKSVGEADLHIETLNDDTKPSECDSRQSYELLLKLSTLRSEQIELERTACNIYHRSLQQATEFYPTDITIGHRWDFDPNKAYLRLTIVISSSVEEVKLIEFEDISGNVLSKGHLLMQPASRTADRPKTSGSPKRSHVVVVPLRTMRDVESRLNLRIHCECSRASSSSSGGGDDKVGGGVSLARVYGKSIHVPKFSMITFAPSPSANECERNKVEPDTRGNRKIRIVFRLRDGSKLAQILDWLNESFLCFKFGQLIENTDGNSSNDNNNNSTHWIQQQTSNPSSLITPEKPTSSHPLPASSSSISSQRRYSLGVDDAESFELNLLDLRHSLLKRIPVDGNKSNRRNPRTLESSNLVETDQEEKAEASQSKFLKLASYLTIAYSNGLLRFESENSDLLVALIKSLVIDRLQLVPSGCSISTLTASTATTSNDSDHYKQEHELLVAEADVEPILSELDGLTNSSRQLEESESRIQTELYESADYTNSLMRQFANANELNEFTTAKELLNELFMMLNGTQNSARAQCLNNRSRLELLKQINGLREKLTFFSTHYS